ncbi:UDP-glucosyltransferase, putative [Ricinus communis]|uniref:UDP-glucosyltransferase, putative n=1 Tax=Ricinus communis TaxID=3988 RepID=B9S2K1_RICCO|nr:UDP-glucosyltransferase, putative [Ricinus communis]|eukprot:XP_002520220.1 UDP-glycosyltransferase 74B1 [Ricinus communis]
MREETEYKGHVVVLPYPGQGHINPLLQFAKRLASKGVKITFATTHYTVNSICAPNVTVHAISDGFDEGGFAQAQEVDLYLKSFKANGSRTLSHLIQKFQDSNFPVNCIVYDSFLPWALDVARQHGIFGAPFFTNSAAVSSIFCRLHHGFLSLPLDVEGDKPLLLPGLPPLYYSDLPTFLKIPESYPAYLAMKLNQFSNLDMADWIFANTFEELESKVVGGVSKLWPAKLIGPMVPSSYLDGRIDGDKGYGASLWKPLGEECLKWLETKQPQSVVYISFGSMVSLTVKQMEEIAWGLKESNLNFLWVVRESEMDKLPKGFIDSTSDKGLIVRWCNQLEMLAHQAIGCFVSHCGWNSTLEALSLGVSMVAIPQWADQLPNAKFIEEIWKVGVRGKVDERGVVRKQEVIRCLKEVMEGKKSEEIKKHARKWRQVAERTFDEGGSSDKNINDFVEHLAFANKKEEAKAKALSGFH